MRKGLLLTAGLAVAALSLAGWTAARAAEIEWLRACGPNYQTQPFDVRNVGGPPGFTVGVPGRFSVLTGSPFEFYPSNYSGRAAICGSWARRVPLGRSPLDFGARTFVTSAAILPPPGVHLEPTLDPESGKPLVPDNSFVGFADVVGLLWPFGYILDPALVPIQLKLTTDSRRQTPLAEQLPGDGAEAETRMGCPLESDLGKYEDIVSCTKVDLPAGLGSNWQWALRIYDPEAETYRYEQTIGELFGPGNSYATTAVIRTFFQCESIGAVGGDRCGEDPKAVDPVGQNIHFNGYAAFDETCADHSDPYGLYTVRVHRSRIEDEKPATATACAGWRVAK